MKRTSLRVRRAIPKGVLLLAGCGLIACGEFTTTAPVAPAPASPPSVADLSPEQRELFDRPVPAEALVERPATQQELQAFFDRFPPGHLEALLTVANRRAAARGEDTIPHCLPRCGTGKAPAQ
ncbi:MAG TPA: hypothetical protein VE871_08365 [Longimicrobium sp.]|nr:hypothetical protein [Longimicrobium sp.]